MCQRQFRYSVRIHRADGSCVCQVDTPIDWQPALEWTWFQGLRRELVERVDGTRSSLIRPLWHAEIGEPYVMGFRVTILSENRGGVTEDFTTAYLRHTAKRVVLDLVRDGRLDEGDSVRCLFTASFEQTHAKAGPTSPFTVRERPVPLEVGESRFSDVAGVAARDKGADSDGRTTGGTNRDTTFPLDFPIVIPRRVLEDARGLVRASRPNESGGILVGRLYRDVETRDLFADVTAAIPAQHTTSAVDRLTFTPETWAAAATELDRRGRGEIYLGWFHSHPGPEQCASCPDEKKALCALGHGFLSADDRLFHRVVFPRAYSFALVFSPTTGDEIEHALFGWRRGVLEKREAHVTGNGRERSIPLDAKVPDETPRGGNEHVTECPSEDTRRKHDPRASS